MYCICAHLYLEITSQKSIGSRMNEREKLQDEGKSSHPSEKNKVSSFANKHRTPPQTNSSEVLKRGKTEGSHCFLTNIQVCILVFTS